MTLGSPPSRDMRGRRLSAHARAVSIGETDTLVMHWEAQDRAR